MHVNLSWWNVAYTQLQTQTNSHKHTGAYKYIQLQSNLKVQLSLSERDKGWRIVIAGHDFQQFLDCKIY